MADDVTAVELVESIKVAAINMRSALKLPDDSPIEARVPGWAFARLDVLHRRQLSDANVITVAA